jgi:hypothetical protein
MRWQSLALVRIAIAEAPRRPRVAAIYRSPPGEERNARLATLAKMLADGGRIKTDSAERFAADLLSLLRGALYYDALLGITPAPTKAQIEAHARAATEAALRAHGQDRKRPEEPTTGLRKRARGKTCATV